MHREWGKEGLGRDFGISIEKQEGISISQFSVSSGNGGSCDEPRLSTGRRCKSQCELALLLGWNCGVSAQCWDGTSRVWVFSYCEDIEKVLKAQVPFGNPPPVFQWIGLNFYICLIKRGGEVLLHDFISEIFVHHILAKLTFYIEEEWNNHQCLYEYSLSDRHYWMRFIHCLLQSS